MTTAKTLLQLAGADLNPPRLGDAALVLIDIQNEYLEGPLALPDARPAIARAAALLARARDSGAAIIHIAHRGKAGSLFDRGADRGAIVAELSPRAGELVIEKELPNAFAGTDLQARLAATDRKNIVLAGFMTRICASAPPPVPRSTSAFARRSAPTPAPRATCPTASAARWMRGPSTRLHSPSYQTASRSSRAAMR
jgi:isochorismate hydrolase